MTLERPTAFRASGQHGTRAEVRELFYATPARLKFLKSTRSEDLAITDMVKRKLHVLNSAGKSETIIKHWEKLGRPLPTFYTKGKAA